MSAMARQYLECNISAGRFVPIKYYKTPYFTRPF
jgi:hypothetical protein